jgi:hypothetical protein
VDGGWDDSPRNLPAQNAASWRERNNTRRLRQSNDLYRVKLSNSRLPTASGGQPFTPLENILPAVPFQIKSVETEIAPNKLPRAMDNHPPHERDAFLQNVISLPVPSSRTEVTKIAQDAPGGRAFRTPGRPGWGKKMNKSQRDGRTFRVRGSEGGFALAPVRDYAYACNPGKR